MLFVCAVFLYCLSVLSQAASELLVAAEEEVAGKMALAERAVAAEVEAGQAVADSAKALEKAERLAEDIAAVQRNAASIAAQKTVQLANQLAEAAASLASAGLADEDGFLSSSRAALKSLPGQEAGNISLGIPGAAPGSPRAGGPSEASSAATKGPNPGFVAASVESLRSVVGDLSTAAAATVQGTQKASDPGEKSVEQPGVLSPGDPATLGSTVQSNSTVSASAATGAAGGGAAGGIPVGGGTPVPSSTVSSTSTKSSPFLSAPFFSGDAKPELSLAGVLSLISRQLPRFIAGALVLFVTYVFTTKCIQYHYMYTVLCMWT